MHLAIGTVLHQLFTFQEPVAVQRRNSAIILAVLVPFVIYHCLADEFVLHVALFFCMCWIVAFRTRYLIAKRIADERDRHRIRALVTFATWCALVGYAIWNIDVHFCPELTRWKRAVGMPFGVLLELHGYWHILTAIAAYAFMAIIEFLTSPHGLATHGVGFAWPADAVLRRLSGRKIDGR